MAQYKNTQLFEATQWYKNGDHPLDHVEKTDPLTGEIITAEMQKENDYEGAVVRRFRHPGVNGTDVCPSCNRIVDDHGWIDSDLTKTPDGAVVCPSDYVIGAPEGQYASMPASVFEGIFEKVSD